MTTSVRSKLIKIGNSRGVRIPHTIIAQVSLTDEVLLQVEGETLVIHAVREPRRGWGAQFAAMAQNDDDHLLDTEVITQWDNEEWTW